MNTEQLITWAKKNKIITGCAALILILAVLVYFTSGDVPQARSTLDDLSSQEAKLQANIEYSARLTEQYKELVDANAAIATRMIKPSQLALNLQYFYKLESDTGTKLVEVHQNPMGFQKGAKPLYEPVGFGLAIDGDWSSVIDVMRRLENSPHLCRINSVTLSSASSQNGPATNLLHMGLAIDLEAIP